ncbi:hypothetical protein F506_09550 [Herbaspirillum hiltneri N3]|uniref:Uncharacterized protein n=1 Tax=Herbaspirillum hiltneri N3 TaxID=1262470 RepID=A0ABN4HW56_9BURK|nr:hypothetical protein F506_09550 [Herbaspirillum hiltneri N3]
MIELPEHIRVVKERIDVPINGWGITANSALCQKIQAMDGLEAITATAMVAAAGDVKELKNGRHLFATSLLLCRKKPPMYRLHPLRIPIMRTSEILASARFFSRCKRQSWSGHSVPKPSFEGAGSSAIGF